MHKKDYLVRQFEEFGKVLTLILTLKKENDWDKFQQEINEASKKFTAIDLNYIEKLTSENYDLEIVANSSLSQIQKKIIANLLFEKLNFYSAKKDEGNYQNAKLKCIALYTHLQNNLTKNEFDLDVHYKINLLQKI